MAFVEKERRDPIHDATKEEVHSHESSEHISSQHSDIEHEASESNPSPPPDATPAYVAPNGGYGWVMVICCALINAHTWGLNSSYGVFLAHYLETDSYPGASRLEFAFVGGLSIAMSMLVAPLATYTTKRFGTHTTLFIGVFFETIALIGASFASQIWHLFLSQGVCFGWGMGFLFVGSVGIIPQWFTTKRSFATSISAAGSGLGGLMYSLSSQAIINKYGVEWAFRILGILACVVNSICAATLRDRNKQIGSTQIPFDVSLLRRYEFLLLCAYGLFSMLGYVVLIFSLPNYANSIGLTPSQGAVIGAVLNLGQALGRPPIGFFSDSLGRINMSAAMTFLSGLFCLVIWVFADNYGVLIFYSIIGGTVAGTFWATIAPVTTEVVGLKHLPSALSLTWLNLVLPTTFSEPIALEIVSARGGNYLGAQLFAGFMYMGAFISLALLRAWKMADVERVAAVNEKRPGSLDVTRVTSRDAGSHAASVKVSPFRKRLFGWRKV